MSTIYVVSDGNIAAAADLNQLVTALNSVLGVTDTAQVNLGKVTLPWLTSDPSSPPSGSLWFRSNLGDAGRLMARLNGVTVPLIGQRQEVRADQVQGSAYALTTSYSDVPDLSVAITTTGGRLEIGVINNDYIAVTSSSQMLVRSAVGAAAGDTLEAVLRLRVLVGGTTLPSISMASLGKAYASGDYIQNEHAPPGFVWNYKPAAGTYTVKLQGRYDSTPAGGAAAGSLLNLRLVVREYLDN